MIARVHAARVITKRRLFETLISPGFYLALTVGLALGFFLVTAFIKSIDSGGFHYTSHPMYDLLGRSFEAAFGKTFVEKLFAEGPFLFALYVSFLPILLYLAVSSAFRFGLEKKVGAIELLTYGPADGTAYFMASMLKDVILTIVSMAVLLVFFGVSALLNNLVLGPMFLHSMVLILFMSAAIFSYGILVSTLTDSSAAAVALFIGIMAFFLVIMMGSFAIISRYVQTLSGVLLWVVKWLSPFFYWDLGMRAFEEAKAGASVLNFGLLAVLTVVMLFLSHITLRIKGVRP